MKVNLIEQAVKLRDRLRARLIQREKDLRGTKTKQVQKWAGLSYKVRQLQRLLEAAEKRLQRRDAAARAIAEADLKPNQWLRVYTSGLNNYLTFEIIENPVVIPSPADQPTVWLWNEKTIFAKKVVGDLNGLKGKQAAFVIFGFLAEMKKGLKNYEKM